MQMTEQRPLYGYEIGEEVVVKLEAGSVLEVVVGDLAVTALPAWAIGEVVAREAADGVTRYTVTFAWAEATYRCTVPESAVEGTA